MYNNYRWIVYGVSNLYGTGDTLFAMEMKSNIWTAFPKMHGNELKYISRQN